MGSLESSFEQLKLEKSLDDGLVDVTDQLKRLTNQLKPQTIVKAPDFDLFEGTHSLEINNKKLDSTLLQLPTAEQFFDCNLAYGDSEVQMNEFVTGISDRLLRSVMTWLTDYQSLPTTVLCCRYVEVLIMQFTEDPKPDLSSCRLNTGNELYDEVLVGCVLGLASFIGFVQSLFRAGVIFEEEDLNCNTMGLNMLMGVTTETVLQKLERGRFILTHKFPQSAHLTRILELVMHLVTLGSMLPDQAEISGESCVETLQKLIGCATELQIYDTTSLSVPPGCFSVGIQKRLSNQFPPKSIAELRGGEYEAYERMAKDICEVFKLNEAQSVFEIYQAAYYFNKGAQRHVIARALFPLHLMRDDQTVLGKMTFLEFSEQHIRAFSLHATSLSHALQDAELSPSLIDKFDAFMQESSAALFAWYQNMSQNSCRYRQGFNRQLLVWDSLQAQVETFEMELESLEIKDEIAENRTLLPLTSWTFFMKLSAMLEFVLNGFELDIYKPREYFAMYWYAYYLTQHSESCLDRLHTFIRNKIAFIQSMNKRLKKLKAGEKKNALRTQYRWYVENDLPQLSANQKSVTTFAMKCLIVKNLCLAEVFQFATLKSYGLIDYDEKSNDQFSSTELIHKLRFKTFSSIGVPELPSYEMFCSSLNEFVVDGSSRELTKSSEFIVEELSSAASAIDTLIAAITEGDDKADALLTGTRVVKDAAIDHYQRLRKSVDHLRANSQTMHEKFAKETLQSASQKFAIDVERPPESSKLFPFLTIRRKSD
ncbi:LAMI_0D11430g1_1 [Lachancea mirantina]|uniref:LAMI_0D11430g1_1 n=1 Tax=Lachancea mirantina TaxID=1230905 RepID=A0A1G4JF23_9SACH|nr:LAMI_0D11430g1_1 [Lachancea mirantina]